MNRRVITISSQTMAIKAQRLLQQNGIKAKVMRLHPSQTPRGCSHGVEVDVLYLNSALTILDNAGISYTGVERI